MSRVRQFGELRNSRSVKKENLVQFAPTAHFEKVSSAHSHYMCVNCVNRSMSQQKNELRTSQRDRENSYLLELGKSRFDHEKKIADDRTKRIQSQKKQVLTYNKKEMKTIEQRKEMEKNQKQQERKLQELTTDQYQKKLAQDRRRQALLKQKWRKDIDMQVQLKNKKLQKEREENFSPNIKEQERAELVAKVQHERLQRYRNQLLTQIKEGQQRRAKEKVQRSKEKDIQAFTLLDKAEQRAKITQEAEHQRKQRLLQERKVYEAQLEQKRLEEKQRFQKEKVYERATKEREDQRMRDLQKRRQSQIQDYLTKIKQQIEDKNSRRKNDKIWQRTTINESFLKARIVDEKLCDSCEKTYPTAYLTKVSNE